MAEKITKMLEEKYGPKWRSIIMKTATGVYRKIKEELGVDKLPAKVYRAVLSAALKFIWETIRKQKRIPTLDEVYTHVKNHPKVKAALAEARAALAKATA